MLWFIIWIVNQRQDSVLPPAPSSSIYIQQNGPIHNWTNTVLTQWHRNTGTLSFNTGSFVSMETNSSVINYRAKSEIESRSQRGKTWTQAFPQQVMDLIKLGGSERDRNRNLHIWCLLCAGPEGSWAVLPRWDHPALSCHPHPPRRWGAWAGWCPPSSCWSCAPVTGNSRHYIEGFHSFTEPDVSKVLQGFVPFLHRRSVEAVQWVSPWPGPRSAPRRRSPPTRNPPRHCNKPKGHTKPSFLIIMTVTIMCIYQGHNHSYLTQMQHSGSMDWICPEQLKRYWALSVIGILMNKYFLPK